MSEALVVQDKQQQSSVHLVARNPVEMQNAQADLTVWLKNKIIEIEIEYRDLDAALNEAVSAGWGLDALRKQLNKTAKQEEFYRKLLAAVEAGYTIIPDIPVEVFAIRVERAAPRGGTVSSDHGPRYAVPNDEKPDKLAVGQGDYVSPVPEVWRHETTMKRKDETTYTRHLASPSDFRDVVFPLRAARVEVMNATKEAMAHKIFDQVAICPAKRKADPLIIGQVVGPKATISFIIAWHLNLNEL